MVEPTALSLADDKLVPIEDVELGMLREVVSVFCCDDDMTSGLTELDLEASDQSCDVALAFTADLLVVRIPRC